MVRWTDFRFCFNFSLQLPRLLRAERLERVDLGGASRREPAGGEGDDGQNRGGGSDGQQTAPAKRRQRPGEIMRQVDGADQADDRGRQHGPEAAAENQANDVAHLGAERHADADFRRALGDQRAVTP